MTTQQWTGAIHYDGTGTVTYDDTAETVTVDSQNSGDFWGTADNGSILYRTWVADDIAKLLSNAALATPDNQRLVGLRSSVAAGAREYIILTDADGTNMSIVWRDADNAVMQYAGEEVGAPYNGSLPLWMKFTYDGTTVTGYTSQNSGQTWTALPSKTITGLTLFFLASGGAPGQIPANTFDNRSPVSPQMAIIAHDTMGSGKNKQAPPYLRKESWVVTGANEPYRR